MITYLNTNMKNMIKMQEMIPNRMTCLYLVYNSICMLNAQEQCEFTKEQIKEWVYE